MHTKFDCTAPAACAVSAPHACSAPKVIGDSSGFGAWPTINGSACVLLR